MPSGAWWLNNGEDSRWTHNWESLLHYTWGWGTSATYVSCQVGSRDGSGYNLIQCFQKPLLRVTTNQLDNASDKDGIDRGYFYAKKVPGGNVLHPLATWVYQRNGQPTDLRCMPVVGKNGSLADGDLAPAGLGPDYCAYVTPFIGGWPNNTGLFTFHLYFPMDTGTWELWHYNPWAWVGTPPEVVAAALMKCGLSQGFIDTDTFDDAHDEYDPSTGASPYSDWPSTSLPGYSVTGKYQVYASRVVGEKLIDFLVEVARHGMDIYHVNEAGKVAVSSWTNPPTHTGGLTFDDGVTKATFTQTDAHLWNRAFCTWGRATKASGDPTIGEPEDANFECQAVDEERLESYAGDDFETDGKTNATSAAKFGTVWLPGQDYLDVRAGVARKVRRNHFPMQLEPGPTLAEVPLLYWVDSFSKPRKEIEVEQDLQGADYGIGYKVEDVQVTGDGVTVSDTRCISKSYDFDALTVQSTLLEIPANTVGW